MVISHPEHPVIRLPGLRLPCGVVAACLSLFCATDMGLEPPADAGRGAIIVLEKNNLPARVFLDYRATGLETPATIENVPAGRHTVHLTYAHYQPDPAVVTVEVAPRQAAEARFELKRAAAGSLEIRTEPSGATVTLNGIDAGTSPLTLDGVPAGTFRVNARLDNFRGVDTMVTVAAPGTATVRLRLAPVRSVLIEYFSNVSCPGCPVVGAAVDHLLEQLPHYRGMVAKLSYHANYPAPNDPLYLAAPAEQLERAAYYGIQALPSVRINGSSVLFTNERAFIEAATALIQTAAAEQAEDVLTFSLVRRDQATVSGALTARVVSPGYLLYIALVEDFLGFDAPPGNNGQKQFHAVFRGFSPQAKGLVAPGGEASVPFTLDCSRSGRQELSVVAWLQDPQTRDIIQSLTIHLPPE